MYTIWNQIENWLWWEKLKTKAYNPISGLIICEIKTDDRQKEHVVGKTCEKLRKNYSLLSLGRRKARVMDDVRDQCE